MEKKPNNRFNVYTSDTKDIAGVEAAHAAATANFGKTDVDQMSLLSGQSNQNLESIKNLSKMMRIEFTIYDENDRKGYTANMTIDRNTPPEEIKKMVAAYLNIMGQDPKDYNLA